MKELKIKYTNRVKYSMQLFSFIRFIKFPMIGRPSGPGGGGRDAAEVALGDLLVTALDWWSNRYSRVRMQLNKNGVNHITAKLHDLLIDCIG